METIGLLRQSLRLKVVIEQLEEARRTGNSRKARALESETKHLLGMLRQADYDRAVVEIQTLRAQLQTANGLVKELSVRVDRLQATQNIIDLERHKLIKLFSWVKAKFIPSMRRWEIKVLPNTKKLILPKIMDDLEKEIGG